MKLPALTIPLPILILALALFMPGASPTAIAGDDGPTTTLLVKLPSEQVQPLVAWVHDKGGRVVDTETMSRLVPVGVPQPDPKPVITRTDLPKLASAGDMLGAVLGAAKEARGSAAAHTLVIEAVSIQGHYVKLKFTATTIEVADTMRVALGNNPQVAARLKDGQRGILVGSSSRLKDERWRFEISMRFENPYAGTTPLDKQPRDIKDTHVHHSANAAAMTAVYASAVRDDPNRREGIRTRWRDYQFQRTSLSALQKLIANVQRGGLVVSELRYSRLPDREQQIDGATLIEKPRLRIATISPLSE